MRRGLDNLDVVKTRILRLLALGLLLAVTPAVATATPAAAGATSAAATLPSRSQIHAAIVRAKRSHGLWATVNICNTRKHQHTIGIRAQMPALGFPATLQMLVSLNYYSQAGGRFKPLAHTQTPVSLGTATSGYHQGGVTFMVTPPAILDGTIEFVWRSGRRVLGSTTRTTRAGHTGARQGDPAGFSAATCRISS
jgi:hypothetical protein